jgi:hypothetical protein
MKHHHILSFLFEQALATVFLVGGLGIENSQNGLREVTMIFSINYFWSWAEEKVCRSKPGPFDELEV